jgi:hypothetical protein
VQLLRRDPISAPKPNSSPSVKRVDAFTSTAAASTSPREPAGGIEIARQDRFGVTGAVTIDVHDRGVQIRRRRHRHLQIEEFTPEIVVGRRLHVRGRR